ncbi:MAG TPA: low molecular weight protein-tyrosine-phosphatase [Trebonia sp.]
MPSAAPLPPPAEPLPPPRDPAGPYRICCVCLGNICRSPMADAVLRAEIAKAGLDQRVIVDSAGTGDWHLGERMHRSASSQLNRNGYDGDTHRARQFDRSWLAERDLVLAMDASNLRDLRALAGADEERRIRLFGEVGDLRGAEVPDPYYGGDAEFAGVLAMLETGMANLVARLKALPDLPG